MPLYIASSHTYTYAYGHERGASRALLSYQLYWAFRIFSPQRVGSEKREIKAFLGNLFTHFPVKPRAIVIFDTARALSDSLSIRRANLIDDNEPFAYAANCLRKPHIYIRPRREWKPIGKCLGSEEKSGQVYPVAIYTRSSHS